MKLRESILIAADASEVWPYLADPLLQSDWNPKIISIDRSQTGPVKFGERFEMIYRLSGRDRSTRVEVTHSQPPHRVTFLHRIPTKSVEQIVAESYDITPHSQGVKVIQTIDFTRAGIPLPFRWLMWFIHRFGRNTTERYLERLKRLVEQPTTPK